MTQYEIIEMARQAGFFTNEIKSYVISPYTFEDQDLYKELEAFAKLVAAKEREACAKVCDDKVDAEYATGKVDHNEMGWTQSCAIAIRARGEA